MRLLLDTRVWLWMVAEPGRLTDDAKALLTASTTDLFLSSASVWEIGAKLASGRVKFPGRPEVHIPLYIKRSGVQPLPITAGHALRALELPPHHGDTYDRMLIGQALVEELTLATADPGLAVYEVPLLQVAP
ncbi:MAG: type II toxin-antitoxin system VapC family toxin [Candidatus Limnocylindria bacterium]